MVAAMRAAAESSSSCAGHVVLETSLGPQGGTVQSDQETPAENKKTAAECQTAQTASEQAAWTETTTTVWSLVQKLISNESSGFMAAAKQASSGSSVGHDAPETFLDAQKGKLPSAQEPSAENMTTAEAGRTFCKQSTWKEQKSTVSVQHIPMHYDQGEQRDFLQKLIWHQSSDVGAGTMLAPLAFGSSSVGHDSGHEVPNTTLGSQDGNKQTAQEPPSESMTTVEAGQIASGQPAWTEETTTVLMQSNPPRCAHAGQRAWQLQNRIFNESSVFLAAGAMLAPFASGSSSVACDAPATSLHDGQKGNLQSAQEPPAENMATVSECLWTEQTTTVLVQNIPSRCSRSELLRAFPSDGSYRYNFLYLPYGIKQRRTAGFVILNFDSSDTALSFKLHFQGLLMPMTLRARKPMRVLPSTVQGLKSNVLLAAEKLAGTTPHDGCLPLVFIAGAEALLLAALHPDCLLDERDNNRSAEFHFHRLAQRLSQHMRL